ncbi:hypothetical protein F5141DRAFT_74661 [Pisolithus sp. B1]|nr:hypothetical protein F5141DRAFT_74661 [Pisolithus sp. B1]
MASLLPHDIPTDAASSAFDVSMFNSYLISLPLTSRYPALLQRNSSPCLTMNLKRVTWFSAEGGGVIYVVKIKGDSEGETTRLRGGAFQLAGSLPGSTPTVISVSPASWTSLFSSIPSA